MDGNLEQARTLFREGVADYQAGRLEQAERKFAAALALAPGRPSVLTNLGAVRLKLGRPHEAVGLLREALAQEPDNAEAQGHCATALAELGRCEEALVHFERALALDARAPALWTLRGSVLKELGRDGEAEASWRTALERGGDAALLTYYLAGLHAAPAPDHAPREYVEALFDGYAEGFEQHLVQGLRYDAPRVLLEPLAATRFRHALDLGCGTGLAGPGLRRLAERVTGVDISSRMLQQATARGSYDALHHADVAAFLRESAGPFDLVLAADVFVYVGATDEVFGLLAARMPPGGDFCFTVEESGGAPLQLRASLRYAHSEAGLRRSAAHHGFAVRRIERRTLREDQRQPVGGLFCWLQRE